MSGGSGNGPVCQPQETGNASFLPAPPVVIAPGSVKRRARDKAPRACLSSLGRSGSYEGGGIRILLLV